MQIKSWQIALAGIVIQSLILLILLRVLTMGPDLTGRGEAGLGIGIFLMFLTITILSGFTLILFLYFEKTRKFGAIIGIISLPLFLLFISSFAPVSIDTILAAFILFPVGIFFCLAGVYYFWKKV